MGERHGETNKRRQSRAYHHDSMTRRWSGVNDDDMSS